MDTDGTALDPGDAFAELGRIVLGEEPLEQVLQRIVHIASRVLPRRVEASITLISDDRPVTAAFTGEALALDERQYDVGSGPCLHAAHSGIVVSVGDMTADGRWPEYASAASDRGVLSSLSVPLPLARRVPAGALNFYASELEAFSEDVVELARTFAGQAAVAIANAELFHATAALAEQMQQAMASRAVIEQAKGILMRDRRCGADDAFDVLVRLSQESHRKLRDVAQRIVDDVTGTP
jgi:GAF domain-containing protein